MNHPVGPQALFRVRHLFCQNTRQALGRHPGAGQHALALDEARGGDDGDQVAEAVAPAFQQQRHVKHHDLSAATA